MKQYSLGFSLWGLLCVVLVMLPNIAWAAASLANDPLAANTAPNLLLDILENAGRIGLMLALVFVVRRPGSVLRGNALLLFPAGVCLLCYYALWSLYFAGMVQPLHLLGMAVFPCGVFLFCALWLKNYPALVPLALFAFVHVGVTAANFL